jgi:protein arginine kinase
MKIDLIGGILKKQVSWLTKQGPDSDIAISSRIRLARNIKGIPFPVQADSLQLNETVDIVHLSLVNSPLFADSECFDMSQLSQLEADILFERHLISKEFSKKRKGSSLVINAEADISLMINEEDHLRIQCILPGFQFDETWSQIDAVDTELSRLISYEFDPELGFLTSCPSNLGTGMRASVMVHLPALSIAGFSDAIVQSIFKMGFTVRGLSGEGSANLGNLFQISNQSTLGETEDSIIKRLSHIVQQIIKHERNARKKLLETRKNYLLDKIGRAFGILRYSYLLSTPEALESLSMLKLGVDMNIISSVDINTVNKLFITSQPAHLQNYLKSEMNSEKRDEVRAELFRKTLSNSKNVE